MAGSHVVREIQLCVILLRAHLTNGEVHQPTLTASIVICFDYQSHAQPLNKLCGMCWYELHELLNAAAFATLPYFGNRSLRIAQCNIWTYHDSSDISANEVATHRGTQTKIAVRMQVRGLS